MDKTTLKDLAKAGEEAGKPIDKKINVDKKEANTTKFTLSGTGTNLEEAIQIFAEKTTNN